MLNLPWGVLNPGLQIQYDLEYSDVCSTRSRQSCATATEGLELTRQLQSSAGVDFPVGGRCSLGLKSAIGRHYSRCFGRMNPKSHLAVLVNTWERELIKLLVDA
jgi:hypothetical protein